MQLFAADGPFDIDGSGFADAALDGRQFGFGALNDRPLEPEAGAEQPPDGDNQGCSQHHYRGVVEVQSSNRSGGGQHEEDGDEDHPDHGDPANGRAPGSQPPGAGGEFFREAAQQDRQDIGDIQPDGGNGGNSRVGGVVENRRNRQDKGTDNREQDGIARRAPLSEIVAEVVGRIRAVGGEGVNAA